MQKFIGALKLHLGYQWFAGGFVCNHHPLISRILYILDVPCKLSNNNIEVRNIRQISIQCWCWLFLSSWLAVLNALLTLMFLSFARYFKSSEALLRMRVPFSGIYLGKGPLVGKPPYFFSIRAQKSNFCQLMKSTFRKDSLEVWIDLLKVTTLILLNRLTLIHVNFVRPCTPSSIGPLNSWITKLTDHRFSFCWYHGWNPGCVRWNLYCFNSTRTEVPSWLWKIWQSFNAT